MRHDSPAPPRVAVLIGSDSDLPVVRPAVDVLSVLDVGADLHVTSAHRTPERTRDIVRTAVESGVRVFLVGAGGAAHLAGTVASLTTRPVLGVPIPSTPLGGLDALLSTVQMPAGIPVGTLAIGEAGARNAALLAVSILALDDTALHARLVAYRRRMADGVEEKSRRARLAVGLADDSPATGS
ncbi:MAG: 5-(carboxyamino)imidazole ribonucleotide mutase [Acidobacteriota bacterium]